MDKSNKIENLANKYVERHIRDRHLSDDTIKEIKIAYIMIIKDFIAIVDKSTSLNLTEKAIFNFYPTIYFVDLHSQLRLDSYKELTPETHYAHLIKHKQLEGFS